MFVLELVRTHLAAGAVAAVLALVAGLLVAVPAAADDDGVQPARVDGADRYETAANIARHTHASADTAILATGQDYPDGLAAAFAAGSVDGPILLTGAEQVPASTWAALDELAVQDVVVVGGTAAVSAAVTSELADAGYDVDRVEGVNRYQTASAVAMRSGTGVGVGELEGDRTAILASGASFADALAAGPVAAAQQLPLFLTPPDTTEFSVNRSLEQLDIERIVIVGGTAAVSSAVVEHYEAAGYAVERWAGATRTETAQVVADNASARLGFSPDLLLLARGDDFADALAAGAHGGVHAAPLLLAATPAALDDGTRAWIREACADISVIRALGGTAAVSDAALSQAVLQTEFCHEPGEFIGEITTVDRQSDPFPGDGEMAELVEVRTGEHELFDRVVFEFDGPELPGWATALEDTPLRHPQSGQEIPLDGEAYVGLSFVPAHAHWGDGGYDGPERIAVDGESVTDVVLTMDHEDQLLWAIGLEAEEGYAVGFRESPTRFVVDVPHPDVDW